MGIDFNDKIIIVTGGTVGIGKVICKEFLKNGASVVFTSRHEEEGRKVQEEFKLISEKCLYLKCDAGNEDEIQNLIKKTIESFSRIDVLINNAALNIHKIMDKCTADEFDMLYKINLRGYFLTSKYAIPYLKKTEGNIVNNSSIIGEVGQYYKSLYCATKGGITAFTRAIALDYAKYNIRANAVLPGAVYTRDMKEDLGRKKMEYPKQFIEDAPLWQPLGRKLCTSEEVAYAVLFLASDMASGITGTTLVIDRGATLDLSPGMYTYFDKDDF